MRGKISWLLSSDMFLAYFQFAECEGTKISPSNVGVSFSSFIISNPSSSSSFSTKSPAKSRSPVFSLMSPNCFGWPYMFFAGVGMSSSVKDKPGANIFLTCKCSKETLCILDIRVLPRVKVHQPT